MAVVLSAWLDYGHQFVPIELLYAWDLSLFSERLECNRVAISSTQNPCSSHSITRQATCNDQNNVLFLSIYPSPGGSGGSTPPWVEILRGSSTVGRSRPRERSRVPPEPVPQACIS